jgi:hypothetical protein
MSTTCMLECEGATKGQQQEMSDKRDKYNIYIYIYIVDYYSYYVVLLYYLFYYLLGTK